MGTKVINITNHTGEINKHDTCEHHFDKGNFIEYNGDEDVVFYVGINVIDDETNSILRVEKDFETKESALSYLKMFVSKKPICEAIIIEKKQKEICHYV